MKGLYVPLSRPTTSYLIIHYLKKRTYFNKYRQQQLQSRTKVHPPVPPLALRQEHSCLCSCRSSPRCVCNCWFRHNPCETHETNKSKIKQSREPTKVIKQTIFVYRRT